MVSFTFEGTHYELGFNRRTAEMLQNQGFKRDELYDKSFVMIPMLVRASFAMNHKGTKIQEIDRIYAAIPDPDKPKVLRGLLDSFTLTQTTLFGNSDTESGESDENSDFTGLSID